MFIDSAKFVVKSGKGGAGCVSFRREKHVLQGGPDGGDGGDGGDVFFEVSNNSHTLAFYKGKRLLSAANGEAGASKRMSGKKGENLTLIVPPGTSVLDDETGEVLLDLTEDKQRVLFLKGGKGGLGNTHFKNSVNQTPTYAQSGLAGVELSVRLELKLIADVGLVGFPNAGKSTLISAVSNARPQIANYEFTTLTPKLGQVAVDEFDGFVMADIPGIIEGASQGRGLGLEFLRHIERTKVLLFVIDAASHREAKTQFEALRSEIKSFSDQLFARPFGVVINKIDAISPQQSRELTVTFTREFCGATLCESEAFYAQNDELKPDLSKPLFILPISAATNEGLKELKFLLLKTLKKSAN